jgi:hypothetical protein
MPESQQARTHSARRLCPPGNNPQFKPTIDFYEGLAHLWQGKLTTALPLLAESVHLIPDRGIPRFQLWLCLSCLGRSASAEVVADDLIGRFPKLGEGYVAKALSLSLRGEHRAARVMANKLDELQIAKGSDYLKLWLRARLAEREENLTAPVGTYEQAIAELGQNGWRGQLQDRRAIPARPTPVCGAGQEVARRLQGRSSRPYARQRARRLPRSQNGPVGSGVRPRRKGRLRRRNRRGR